MGTGQNLTVTLTGGGPWGFRLIGGEGYPLQIAKIRKRSKACIGGLQEGDTVICINGVSMMGKSHPDAMYEVDNTGDKLSITVQRDGSAVQPLQPVESYKKPAHISNGISDAPGPKVTTTSQTFRDGDSTTNVVTGTYQQSSGDGRVTRGFVKQVVKTHPTGVVNQQQTTTHTTSYTKQTQSNVSPVKFQVKNLREEFKENYTPMIFGQCDTEDYIQLNDTVRSPRVFMVRDIKGTMAGQQEHQVMSETCEMNQPKMPRPLPSKPPKPVRMVPEQPAFIMPDQVPLPVSEPVPIPQSLVPPAPPPPPPPPPPAPEPHQPISFYPPEEPLFYPLPQAPFVNFDAHAYNEQVALGEKQNGNAENDGNEEGEDRFHGRLPIFAPKVEIHYDEEFLQNGMQNGFILDRPDLLPLDLSRKMSIESDPYTPGSPEPSGVRKKNDNYYEMKEKYYKDNKKLYNDSAFYDAPDTDYPTIEDQITLCKKIARSLTSAANRKARGAKMFAKRKRRAIKWIHDGESHIGSSSGGDVADLRDLDSELYLDDGGGRPLFTFRIPNIRNRIFLTDDDTPKMSISQEEFEQLRLQQKKCDHKAVSPSTCHSLVADLHNQRNRGAKLFQKRQARSEKWVIDESNAAKPMMSQKQINSFLEMSSVQNKAPTPWEAALGDPKGRVDSAFDQTDYKSSLTKHQTFTPAPQPTQVHHDLSGTQNVQIVTGPNFNRTPKGWGASVPSAIQVDGYNTMPRMRSSKTHKQEQPPPPPPKPLKQPPQNYNPKMRAWNPETSGQFHNKSNSERFRGSGGKVGPEEYGYRAADSYHSSQLVQATDL